MNVKIITIIVSLVMLVVGAITYKLNNQANTISIMENHIVELSLQNSIIIKANESLAADMIIIKNRVDLYNKNIMEINENSHKLLDAFNNPKFKEAMRDDLSAANKDYNDMFNSFLQEMKNGSISN